MAGPADNGACRLQQLLELPRGGGWEAPPSISHSQRGCWFPTRCLSPWTAPPGPLSSWTMDCLGLGIPPVVTDPPTSVLRF